VKDQTNESGQVYRDGANSSWLPQKAQWTAPRWLLDQFSTAQALTHLLVFNQEKKRKPGHPRSGFGT
jgi:hypothetical protein